MKKSTLAVKFDRLDQYDYQQFGLVDKWILGDTIIMLVSFYMESNGLFESDDWFKIQSKQYTNYLWHMLDILRNGKINYTNMYDEDDSFSTSHSLIDKLDFIAYLEKSDCFKLNIQQLKRYISGYEIPPAPISYHVPESNISNFIPKINDDIVDNNESESGVFPNYKNLKFSDLTKDKFEGLKRHYGMLKDEESKWRRAVSIAAKIGLLFYERSLNKPTKRPAFIEAYQQEFNAILNNKTVAKYIYDNLPEEYRGGSGTPVNATDMTPIIKAAVYAGSIYDTDDVKLLDKLKPELAEHKYQIPDDDVLLRIIEAVKDI